MVSQWLAMEWEINGIPHLALVAGASLDGNVHVNLNANLNPNSL